MGIDYVLCSLVISLFDCSPSCISMHALFRYSHRLGKHKPTVDTITDFILFIFVSLLFPFFCLIMFFDVIISCVYLRVIILFLFYVLLCLTACRPMEIFSFCSLFLFALIFIFSVVVEYTNV